MTRQLTQPFARVSFTVAMSSQRMEGLPERLLHTIPIEQDDYLQCKNAGGSLEVNLQKIEAFFLDMSFVLSRISIPAVVDLVKCTELS
jgi:hypothetical protein